MEARGLPTAHLGVRLLTPQEGATGVSMLRGDYKARGARGLLPDQPRVQPSLGTYGDAAHAHAAISLVGAMHAAGVPAAVRNAWLGAAGSGSLKEIFSGLEAEAEAEAGEVSGVAEAGEPVEAEGGAGEAEEVIEAGEVELGAEAPTFDLDNDAYHDVAAVQAVSPTSSPSPKPNPIARPHQPQTQLSVLKPEPQAQPHRPTPTTPTTSTRELRASSGRARAELGQELSLRPSSGRAQAELRASSASGRAQGRAQAELGPSSGRAQAELRPGRARG